LKLNGGDRFKGGGHLASAGESPAAYAPSVRPLRYPFHSGVGVTEFEMLPFDHLDAALEQARRTVEVKDSELPPETRDTIRDVERWVRAAFASARSLLPRDGVASLRVFAQEVTLEAKHIVGLARSPLARPDMEMLLLDEGASRTMATYERLLSILPVLLMKPVNRFTENYLTRVAQLHIWGFDPEVHVMCRAVLDSALQELLPAETVRTALRWKESREISLGVRVQLSRFSDPPILDEATWPVAWRLKEDGNDVVHIDSSHHLYFATTTEAITALVGVLSSLPAGQDIRAIEAWPENANWRPES